MCGIQCEADIEIKRKQIDVKHSHLFFFGLYIYVCHGNFLYNTDIQFLILLFFLFYKSIQAARYKDG